MKSLYNIFWFNIEQMTSIAEYCCPRVSIWYSKFSMCSESKLSITSSFDFAGTTPRFYFLGIWNILLRMFDFDFSSNFCSCELKADPPKINFSYYNLKLYKFLLMDFFILTKFSIYLIAANNYYRSLIS
jgi:hypothetical protein